MATITLQILLLIPAFFVLSFGNASTDDGDLRYKNIEEYICTQKFKGCKIDYSQRSCLESETVGCWNPFPYHDMNECLQDFSGNGNICDQRKPCMHNGFCSPVTNEISGRTYKCECANTGYFGHNCEIKCPKVLPTNDLRTIPCLVI